MFSEEERLATFVSSSASTSAAKKRQSTKSTASSSSLQWPHPVTGRSAKTSGIPTPTILAKNGFYHAPTQQAPDAVSHFLYPDLHIDKWKPSDDPLARLEHALPGNGWCRIFRSAQTAVLDDATGTWTWQEPDLLPTSKEMLQARKETFASQWPYDGRKGWKPTSKKLAEAGFYFTPTDEEPDNAKCIYCSKSLGGWEKSDDPVHEHQRRVPDCAFFNCRLDDASPQPATEEQSSVAAADEEIQAVPPTKKGGKRAVSAGARKASISVTKGKKSAAAAAAQEKESEEEDQLATDGQDGVAAAGAEEETCTQGSETQAPAKKGGRKTRSVSTKKLAANPQVEDEQPAERVVKGTSSQAEDDEPAVEEPVKTLSKKKSATGLGNGIASQAPSARPTRAASRRATKAINLLSDEGLNRKLRRPDEEDLERRAMALSDPIPFPSALSEEQPELSTDPAQPAKPKKSRSRSKKLDQEATTAATLVTPEPQGEDSMDEDEVRLAQDATMIEHDDAEEDQEGEPVEEPKRRGGRGGKASVTVAKTSSSGPRSRKASAKLTAAGESTAATGEAEEQEEDEVVAVGAPAMAFPSMSSEADAEPATDRSSRSVSDAVAALSSKSAGAGARAKGASGAGSRKGSASSSSKQGSTKPSSTAFTDGIDTDIDTDAASLPNAGSQATIRGAPRSSIAATMASSTGRTPLSHLPQLTKLELDDSQKGLTLGEWMQMKADTAAIEMRLDGEAQLADLENQLRIGRMAIERRLRGRA
ncbi:hypothetical protein EX895_001583 [Sporisorium graminicola]|uniref:BIR-domain-containing protein n=1 Tax=Sporisorium graminicola TaxID=280036 RepID=A0A4U7L1F0_9BASI|nr:hypothetical protein EX895_001583 [Sporisorium graminicola]TKY89052.1 hypothetical protein EX895_001583 [Sporisorium graminicola]